jgi:hypothetical protein
LRRFREHYGDEKIDKFFSDDYADSGAGFSGKERINYQGGVIK